MACEAKQYSDEMKCGRCGLSWDVNDPDPPACARKIDRRAIPDRRVTDRVRKLENPPATVAPCDQANAGPFFVPPGETRRGVVNHSDKGLFVAGPAFQPFTETLRQAVEPYPLDWQANGRSAWIPEELPDDLAARMAREFLNGIWPDGGNEVDAMRAAYRVFLERVG